MDLNIYKFLKKDHIWCVRPTYFWWKVYIWTTWSTYVWYEVDPKPISQDPISILYLRNPVPNPYPPNPIPNLYPRNPIPNLHPITQSLFPISHMTQSHPISHLTQTQTSSLEMVSRCHSRLAPVWESPLRAKHPKSNLVPDWLGNNSALYAVCHLVPALLPAVLGEP